MDKHQKQPKMHELASLYKAITENVPEELLNRALLRLALIQRRRLGIFLEGGSLGKMSTSEKCSGTSFKSSVICALNNLSSAIELEISIREQGPSMSLASLGLCEKSQIALEKLGAHTLGGIESSDFDLCVKLGLVAEIDRKNIALSMVTIGRQGFETFAV